ncbi:MAG: hypothetical protein J6M90_08380 [Oscillospiraceae bacterium]|jgi:hypothetical protein|nr:hypothetical protein [Oscillospiraceae bacterium]MBQ9208646.1 hypothetical protein [Oscillospiraceae bacterium]MBR4347046.1 hypothetical protein [Oscillospiraceae bacterium]
MAEGEKKFFTYRGFPLVRKGSDIYYGNMYDKYVIMMQVAGTTEEDGIKKANKVRIYKMATDEKLNPMEAIVKNTEKSSLYEALDIAYVWLGKQ